MVQAVFMVMAAAVAAQEALAQMVEVPVVGREGAGGAGRRDYNRGFLGAGGGGGGTWAGSGQFTGGSGGSGGGQAGYGNQVSGYSTNENTGTHLTDGSITLATVNTGSGGGGAGNGSGSGGAGASGVVIIRYKFQ